MCLTKRSHTICSEINPIWLIIHVLFVKSHSRKVWSRSQSPTALLGYACSTTTESTQKRHYYYCRSRGSSITCSRRRSCSACILSKTRCVLSSDVSLLSCTRCDERGIQCSFTANTQNLSLSNWSDNFFESVDSFYSPVYFLEPLDPALAQVGATVTHEYER